MYDKCQVEVRMLPPCECPSTVEGLLLAVHRTPRSTWYKGRYAIEDTSAHTPKLYPLYLTEFESFDRLPCGRKLSGNSQFLPSQAVVAAFRAHTK